MGSILKGSLGSRAVSHRTNSDRLERADTRHPVDPPIPTTCSRPRWKALPEIAEAQALLAVLGETEEVKAAEAHLALSAGPRRAGVPYDPRIDCDRSW